MSEKFNQGAEFVSAKVGSAFSARTTTCSDKARLTGISIALETTLGMGAAMAARDVWPPCPIPDGDPKVGDELGVGHWMPYFRKSMGRFL